jgi:hypothetical protein
MIKQFIFAIFALLVMAANCQAYDDDVSHAELTRSAVINSALQGFLIEHLGYSQGYDTTYHIQVPSFSENDPRNGTKGWQLTEIIQEGSRMEDTPNCRASNHFHNPLKAWADAGLTDTHPVTDSLASSVLAIFVGGIAALVPSRTRDLASLGPKALFAATLGCLITAAVAGVFFTEGTGMGILLSGGG